MENGRSEGKVVWPSGAVLASVAAPWWACLVRGILALRGSHSSPVWDKMSGSMGLDRSSALDVVIRVRCFDVIEQPVHNPLLSVIPPDEDCPPCRSKHDVSSNFMKVKSRPSGPVMLISTRGASFVRASGSLPFARGRLHFFEPASLQQLHAINTSNPRWSGIMKPYRRGAQEVVLPTGSFWRSSLRPLTHYRVLNIGAARHTFKHEEAYVDTPYRATSNRMERLRQQNQQTSRL